MKNIGLIVNPIAGMGGRVGLKGTDGEDILRRAINLGAKPIAPQRAKIMLSSLKKYDLKFTLITAPKLMGEYEAREVGYKPIVIGEISEKTTGEDTRRIAKLMVDFGIDLLVFCGGDGTARDIYSAIDMLIPVIGVPTGVKMHSAVFAVNPVMAASLVADFIRGVLPLRDGEVMDVDESAFRSDKLIVKLYGYLKIPYRYGLVQNAKSPSPQTEDERENQLAIAKYFVESMEKNVLYILGPGTTVKAVADVLNVQKTLLGVDLVFNFKVYDVDVNEEKILKAIKNRTAKIVVSPIGSQGFIFGRGNQQISPEVIRRVGKNNIVVLATHHKLSTIDALRVDTGDPEVDEYLRGYLRVICDYREERIVKVI